MRFQTSLLQAALLVIFVLQPGLVLAATGVGVEIKPFGVLDVGASFAARYLFDEDNRTAGSGGASFQERVT